ncbi:MAG: SUMF1/EgtB/PvdO family nonheme iron enzyme [Nitrospina sp.]|jgi:formylglycine-generating enzyme|nr:SUMF1/EgtB/PvdO family nonheme iron enzyme [Nitrospina sp.]
MSFILIFLSLILLSDPADSIEASETEILSHQGMVFIPAGSFLMGADNNQGYQQCIKNNKKCKEKWFNDEHPSHTVKLDGYHIDIYEVTQEQFERVMGENPSEYTGAQRPVENVTWYEAKKYCEQSGKRLPTEAEWERAARGGNNSVFIWGDKVESGKANFCDLDCGKRWGEDQFKDGFAYSARVGSFPPNNFGLFDMAGNVYEWVNDWHDGNYYQNSPKENPQGPKKGKKKVMRGGSWINYSTGVRPADRTDTKPKDRMDFVGFRCAR